MSITKLKPFGNWALPPTNNNATGRPLTGRVIFGLLTGGEGPGHIDHDIITSAKKPTR